MQDKLQLLQDLKTSRVLKENELKSKLASEFILGTVKRQHKNIQTNQVNGHSYDKNIQTLYETLETQIQTETENDSTKGTDILQQEEPQKVKEFDQAEFDQFLQQKSELVYDVLNIEYSPCQIEDSTVQTWKFSQDSWLTDLCVVGDLIVASYESFKGVGREEGGVVVWTKGDCCEKRVLLADVSVFA